MKQQYRESVEENGRLEARIQAFAINAQSEQDVLNSEVSDKCFTLTTLDVQGPVVQSVVSLTSSLRVISLTVLANSIYNILIFFAEKM